MAEVFNSIRNTTSAGKPGQWKLVAGLAALLVGLLSLGGEEDEETADVSESAAAATESPALKVSANSEGSSTRREILWPDVPLEFLLTHNPFQAEFRKPESAVNVVELNDSDATKSGTAPAESASTNTIAASSEHPGGAGRNETVSAEPDAHGKSSSPKNGLPKMKVQVVVRSARGKAAMIDNRIYHEGDHINGFEIASIANDGVTLRMVQETESHLKTAK